MAEYTYRAVGASTSGTNAPGMPTGWQVGDLLLLATCARLSTETLTDPTGWTRLADTTDTNNDSLILYGRIAESGDAGPTIDWSGTSASRHQIAAFYGDIETDLASIVAHVSTAGSTSSTANLPNPSLVVTTADCLIVGIGKKQKTATSDSATMTSPAGLSNRIDLSWPDGSNVGLVWDYTQQTTATNVAASVWTQSVAESLEYASLVVALNSAGSRFVKVLAHADFASETDIEGVVLNATRDAVIGEFSGQTAEAALESGEAVLLIALGDITPDGSTLTTSDTPIVFAYNATDSLVGPASATVIEV